MSHGGKSQNGSPPHQNVMLETKKNSTPMGIGLGMDYVTWSKILKRIPPTSKLHVGHKSEIPILWV